MTAEPGVTSERPRDEHTLSRAEAVVHRVVADRHDRPSLVSRIACEIGADIIENVRVPGDDLNSVELARSYQTSRTPVREALMLLEKEGLVDIVPRRRPRVAGLSLEQIREVYLARTVLLQLVAGQVAEEATDEGIASLRDLIEQMRHLCEAGKVEHYLWTNVEYQERTTEVANNKTIKRILDGLLLRTIRQRRISLSQPNRMRASFGEHCLLQQAYEARDANLAAALVWTNYKNALTTLEHYLADGTASEEPRKIASSRVKRAELA